MTVSDADRERVVALLREQAAEGRLDMDEFGQRLDEAYQATTVDQLQHALRELPVPAVAPPPFTGTSIPRPPPSSIRRDRHERYDRRDRRPGGPRPPMPPVISSAAAKAAWKAHVYTYIWVNLLLVAIWAMTSPGGYFWPMWSIVPWGVGVAAHGSAHRAAEKARRRRRELGQG